jgi:aconitate hydratase
MIHDGAGNGLSAAHAGARGRGDLWPTDSEIDAVLAENVHREQYLEVYEAIFGRGADTGQGSGVPLRFSWREDST